MTNRETHLLMLVVGLALGTGLSMATAPDPQVKIYCSQHRAKALEQNHNKSDVRMLIAPAVALACGRVMFEKTTAQQLELECGVLLLECERRREVCDKSPWFVPAGLLDR